MLVLSTKTLNKHQKKILDNTGIKMLCYDAIQIKEIAFTLPNALTHCIFTSQNSVRLFAAKAVKKDFKNIQAYCVGSKTAEALKSHGIFVAKQTDYAAELVAYLIANHAECRFDFFCGRLRRETIPEGLSENNIPCKETILYDTILTPKKYTLDFSAVLFFSPSGARSFFECHMPTNKTVAICIGTTTAAEVRNFTNTIEISDTPTIESVLWKTRALVKQ